ncbi:MAG: hypothetical protein AB2A00_14785 [Myxococcota bacterium]
MTECPVCGTRYYAHLDDCPACNGFVPCEECGAWYDPERQREHAATHETWAPPPQ